MSIDTTDSLTPIDLSTPILVSPAGGEPTPLPETRAADGTRKLRSLPPPIPARASTADLIAQPRTTTAEVTAPVGGGLASGTDTKLRAAPRATLPPPIPRTQTSSSPAVARTKTPLPPPNRAKGTVPPPVPARPLTADPDGWSVSPSADEQTPLPPPLPAHAEDELRDIMAPDPEGPDSTNPTPFVEPAATAKLDSTPSPEWLAKIDSVMRPSSAPVFTPPSSELPTTKAAVELFTTKAEAPSMTQPLELVDLEPVAAPAPKPAHPVAAVAMSIGAAPAPAPRAPLPVVPAPLPVVSRPALPVAAAVVSLPAPDTGGFDVDFDADMTSAHTTNFEMPAKRRVSPMLAIGLFAAAAVVTAGYLATRGGHSKKVAAPAAHETAKAEAPAPAPAAAAAPAAVTPAAAPAPAAAEPAAPATQNIAAPAPATQEVAAAPAPTANPGAMSIPVTSKPSGALVTFVDGGHAVVVGRTPATITFDPRQPHDVALTLLDHETQLVTIPSGGMTALVVDMGPAKTGTTSPTVPHVASDVTATRPETPAPQHHAAPVAKAAPKAPPAQKIAQPAPHMAAPAAVPSGSGVLMISSKPPCEIVVDGKSTHLSTPQKSLPLSAGTHTIVLVNAQQKIHKTLAISIAPQKSTKVIQDFTNR